MVSLDVFDKVQARRQSLAKAPARKNIGNDFALRGFVSCGDCGTSLRSSWVKGKTKCYPYYLCQTKTCTSYGKSIPRDKLEGEFAGFVKSLQANKSLFSMVRAIFGDIWDQRLAQAQEVTRIGERDLADIDKQIESLLTRILAAPSDVVIRTYEQKIGELEKSKVRLQETLANRIPPKGRFDEILELSLQFLANPWKQAR